MCQIIYCYIYIFFDRVNEALEAQNRSLACERPEKSYATYLKNHYKIFVGTSKWADSETTNKVQDEDSDVLKVYILLFLKFFITLQIKP